MKMNINFLKKILILEAGVMLTLCASGCGSHKTTELIENPVTPDFEHDTPVGEITSDANVQQTFICNADEITAVELYGATYKRANKGTVVITLLHSGSPELEEISDSSTANTKGGDELTDVYSVENSDGSDKNSGDKKIAEWALNASDFQDNTMIRLDMEDAQVFEDSEGKSANSALKGKTCILEISSPDGTPGSCVTFWTTQEDVYADGCLSIGGYEQYNDLWFNVYGVQ